MRIGIDARLWNETGVGRYIRSLFYYLPKVDPETEYVWFFRANEYKGVELPSQKWRKVEANIRWHTVAEQVLLPRVFTKEKLDLLHIPYFSVPMFYPGKFVMTVHDLIYNHYKTGRSSTHPFWVYAVKKFGYHSVINTAIRRAKYILTMSQDAKREIVSHYRISPKKVVVTYEAGNLEFVPKSFDREQYQHIKNLSPYILYVGNAHPHKNVEALFSAMERVNKKRSELKLVLVGNDSFFYPKLMKYAEKIHAKNVHFAGSVPSEELEGFGIPGLEAMSMNCPVIVSNIPIFREVYGEAAVYFDETDPVDIAEAILDTIFDKEKVGRLVEEGQKTLRNYSWEKMAKETAGVYKKAL